MWWPPPKLTHFMRGMKSPNFVLERRDRALERVAVGLAERVEVQAVEAVEIRGASGSRASCRAGEHAPAGS